MIILDVDLQGAAYTPERLMHVAEQGMFQGHRWPHLLAPDCAMSVSRCLRAIERQFRDQCAAQGDLCLESGCAVEGDACLRGTVEGEPEYHRPAPDVALEVRDPRNELRPNTWTIVQQSPVFEARGLTKVYRMGEVEVHALRGVDLDLFQSEFVVILGPSGSGKSTLLNILGGLDVPSSGHRPAIAITT